MSDETKFPQWGFWSTKNRQLSGKQHLFLTKETTACGWNKISNLWLFTYKFTATPKVDGILDTLSEMKRGRMVSIDDFPKCKKCLKHESKMEN